jgi:electron-transferring-flavoprotein dehydrogenase
MTGLLLAEAVIGLWESGEPFTQENLERSYVAKRRASWVDRELRIAAGARNGFPHGLLRGLFGAGLAALTRGAVKLPAARLRAIEPFSGAASADEALDRRGWPPIAYDGRLLVSHQDALLMGGKVQAAPGYADHVRFRSDAVCRACRVRLCVSMCSGQAITSAGDDGVSFDREKCVHCGACMWNCEQGNVEFTAGAGGLHAVEN